MPRTYRRRRRGTRFRRKDSRRQRMRTRRPRRRLRRSRSRRGGTSVHANGWENNVSNKGPCLVAHHMTGCGACEHFKSAWNSYVGNHKNQCAIAVEREDDPSKYNMGLNQHQKKVSAFPTIMIVDRKGGVLATKVGAVDENTLDEFVKSSRGN